MESSNTIHLSIEQLERIVERAKELKGTGENMSNIVRITKTASRQDQQSEDKVECSLLTSCTIPENVEG